MDPSEVGREHRMVLGKHSGKHMLVKAYQDLGVELAEWQVPILLQQVRSDVTRTKRSPQAKDLLLRYVALVNGQTKPAQPGVESCQTLPVIASVQ